MPTMTTRDGVRLNYQDWGSGPAVLLTNVALMDSRMWEYQAGWLAAHGLRCVTYDRRGTGRSDAPWTGYDYDSLADDIADLLNHLDLRETTLVGYASGGGEAVRYLHRHGAGRIARLALVATTTPFLKRTDDNPDGVATELLESAIEGMAADRPLWAEQIVEPFFHGMAGVTPETAVSEPMQRWMTRIALDVSPPAASQIYRALVDTDQRAELPAISVPTLVIHGDADVASPVELCGVRSSELIPGSRLIRYPDAAHGLFLTHREQLNDDLLAWIKE